MMRAEHYREAERLASLPSQQTADGDFDPVAQLAVMAEALVHALLASAPASVEYQLEYWEKR